MVLSVRCHPATSSVLRSRFDSTDDTFHIGNGGFHKTQYVCHHAFDSEIYCRAIQKNATREKFLGVDWPVITNLDPCSESVTRGCPQDKVAHSLCVYMNRKQYPRASGAHLIPTSTGAPSCQPRLVLIFFSHEFSPLPFKLTWRTSGRFSLNQSDWAMTISRWTRKERAPADTLTSAPKGCLQRLLR